DDRRRQRAGGHWHPPVGLGDGPLAPDTAENPDPQLRRRRIAGLSPQQLSELTLGIHQGSALAAVRAVSIGVGEFAHGERAIDVRHDPGSDLRAVHPFSFTYPCSRAKWSRARRSSARPRDRRDITVPIGHPTTSATSRYVSPSMSTSMTASR